MDYLDYQIKEYVGEFQFGISTDTYDKEGQIVQRYNNKIKR